MYDLLCAQIVAGTYGPGDPLPSIPEITRRYDAGEKSARKVLAALVEDGLAVSVRSRGTFVTDGSSDPPPARRIPPRPRRTHAVRRLAPADAPTPGDGDLTEATTTARAMPPADIALILRSQAEVRIVRSVLADEHGPVMVRMSYRPARPPVGAAATVVTHTSARTPDADEAVALRVGRGSVVLIQDETSYTADGLVVEHVRTVHRGDAVRLSDQYRPRG